MNTTKPICILSLLLLAAIAISTPSDTAEARGVSEALAEMFEEIPASQIETGILYDRVLSLSGIETLDGSRTARTSGLREWRQIYDELYRASLVTPAWPPVERVFERTSRLSDADVIPIALLNLSYDKVREDAFETGALMRREGRLVSGEGNAFEERRVFTAAALRERTYQGSRVRFRLDRDDYITNDPRVPGQIEIDFDDGRGFVSVSFDEVLEVGYESTGSKTITLRCAYADGPSLHASFSFDAIALLAPPPSDVITIVGTIPYNGSVAAGEAFLYLADGHATVTNPVIVIEGFDIDNSMDWNELYDLLNRENLLEDLKTLGFDAVILNFFDASTYLQRNAFVVTELIEEINSMLDPGQDIALVGASMGGLVARYALAYMETNGLEHNVRSFISFDAPHTAANIPLGIQYWLSFFAAESPEAAALLEDLGSHAALQMLVYHLTDPPDPGGVADPERADFLADLAAAGDFPTIPRNVAIANGSGSQADQGFSGGDQIVRWEYSDLFVDIIGNVWAVPDGTTQIIFDGLIDPIIGTTEQLSVIVTGTDPYDSAPGGSSASMAEMDSVVATFGDIIALHGSHCFIPTISALGLATEDLFYDIAGDPDILSLSPFDAVYFPVENQEHVLITPENALWLLDEIQGVLTAVDGPAPLAIELPGIRSVEPNPVDASTLVRFYLPGPGDVRLSVHDVTGRQVAVLANRSFPAGENRIIWDAEGTDGARLDRGVYLLRLNGSESSRKILVR